MRGEPVAVRGRKKPIDILFNLDHPESLYEYQEVEEENEEDDDAEDAEQDDLTVLERIQNRTFVVASKAIAQMQNWVSVTEIFASSGDSKILKKAGVTSFDARHLLCRKLPEDQSAH